MAKRHKYSKTEASDFIRYSRGDQPDQDRNAFERQLQKDPFDADAAEGFARVTGDEAESDLREISARISKRINRTNRIRWIGIAAALVSILAVTTIYINVSDNSMKKYEAAPEFKEAASEKAVTLEEELRADDEIQDKSLDKEKIAPEKSAAIQEFQQQEKSAPVLQTTEKKGEGKGEKLEESPKAAEKGEDVILKNELKEENEFVEQFNLDEYEVQEEMVQPEEEDKKLIQAPVQTPVIQDVAHMEQVSKSARKLEATDSEIQKAPSGRAAGVHVTEIQPDNNISGIIRSADDLEPLPGVNVVIKGTTLGTLTDAGGKFNLNVEDGADQTLVASYVGMETEEFTTTPGQQVELAMMPSMASLDEVVVVGYGTINQDTETGAIEEVELNNFPEYASAIPVNGMSAYKSYIDSTLIYPESITDSSRAVVVLKFSISPDGRPRNFREIRSPGPDFTSEAIRVVKKGADWIPAKRDGEYVDETVRLRIVFK